MSEATLEQFAAAHANGSTASTGCMSSAPMAIAPAP
jgi:hypothetical protein